MGLILVLDGHPALDDEVEEQGVMGVDFVQCRPVLGADESVLLQHAGADDGVDGRQGVVGAIEQARVQPLGDQQLPERGRQAVKLRERGDVGVEQLLVLLVVEQAHEGVEGSHLQSFGRVEIFDDAEAGGVGDDHPHAALEAAAQAQRIAQLLCVGRVHGQLVSGVADERQPERDQAVVKRVAALARWIHAHGVGQPLDRDGAGDGSPIQPLDGVGAVGVDRRAGQDLGVELGQRKHVLVGDEELAPGRALCARFVDEVVESVADELARGVGEAVEREQPFDVLLVGPRQIGDARGVAINVELEVTPGRGQRVHLGVHPATGAARAQPREVHVCIPHPRSIEPFEGFVHQLAGAPADLAGLARSQRRGQPEAGAGGGADAEAGTQCQYAAAGERHRRDATRSREARQSGTGSGALAQLHAHAHRRPAHAALTGGQAQREHEAQRPRLHHSHSMVAGGLLLMS